MAIFNVIIKSGHNIFSTSFALLVTQMQVVTFYFHSKKNSKLTSTQTKTKTSVAISSNKQFQQKRVLVLVLEKTQSRIN